MAAKKSFQDRLDEHTDTRDPNSCWIWGGHIDRDGYGQLRFEGVIRMAHRVSYSEQKGAIPDGLEVDHLCRVRACVNPTHLEAVTPRVNTLRSRSTSAQNAIKTECNSGHAFTEENTYLHRGKRYCRACNRRNVALSKQRKLARAS